MFLVISVERGRLTSCAANDNGICAIFNLKNQCSYPVCIIYRTSSSIVILKAAPACKNGVFIAITSNGNFKSIINVDKLSPYDAARAVLPREHRRGCHAGYCGTGRMNL